MKNFCKLWFASLTFIACTASTTVALRDNMSGTVSVVFNVNPEFERIKRELVATLGGEEVARMPLFPVDEIRKYFKDMGKESGLSLLEIEEKGDSLKLVIGFDSLVKVLKNYLEKEKMPLLKVENKNGKNIIDIDINIENVTKIINENKESINDVLAALLPSEEVPMTGKEYRDVLVYFLSDFTSRAGELIDGSNLKIKIKTSRKIQEQFGFKQTNLNNLEFELNMVEGLSLENPIKLRLVY
ncbi:hypothetical protein LKV13_03210 [Borrelia sp. BU AG58]|uniref:hypothetical protein n=1 Tax=Borrelia sp. BU AG58 TaxID=2887345 RepID=UPI001E4A0C27|nr:hypothetical protein [Borrelia sp. BU AG58]UER67781.1 hypothetical protein LKV13_03210 [Borrelia sp. BU AG58]